MGNHTEQHLKPAITPSWQMAFADMTVAQLEALIAAENAKWPRQTQSNVDGAWAALVEKRRARDAIKYNLNLDGRPEPCP